MKKQKKKVTPPVDCKKAIELTNRMFAIGGIMVVGGFFLGYWLKSMPVICIVLIPGLALMGISYFLHTRWVLCPHCGAYLGENENGMLRKMPEECEFCREPL